MPIDSQSRTRPKQATLGAIAAVALALWSSHAAANPPYAGRTLDDVLRDLGQQGLHLIYSSETVPASLRVTREPSPGTPIQVLDQLLAEHGLAATQVGADSYAIVRGSAPPAVASTPAPPAPPARLEEVVVAASRYSLSASVPDAHTFLTEDQVQGMPRLAEDSLKVVHRLPGAATNGVSGLAYMRGGVNNETLVALDGFPLYEPFHLKLLLSPTSLLDPAIIGGMDVHAGGFTADFGDRMSAVIDATSVHPDADQYQLGLSLFGASLFAFNRFADGKGQWLVAGRRSNLDEIADLVGASYSTLRYSDAFGRLDYEFTPDTRASLHVLVSQDDAEVTNALESESSDAQYQNTYLWATVEHQFSPDVLARAIGSYTYVKTTRQGEVDEEGLRTGFADDHRHYDVWGLKLDATWRTDRVLTRFGAEASTLDASYDYHSVVRFAPDYPFPGAIETIKVNDLSPQPTGAQYAVYATSRVRIVDPLTAEFGLRWDAATYTPHGSSQFGPRVNLVYQAAPRTLLRASWGVFQQAQGINELQVEDGVDHYFRPQRAYHEILGVEQGLPQSFTLRVEGYVKKYSDLKPRFESLYDPTSIVPELRWDLVEIAPRSARAEGVELLLTRKSASPWNGWFNYAWSRVVDRVSGVDTPRSWDQTNNLGGGITWSDDPWRATIAATYHTGWPTTPLHVAGSTPGSQTVVVGQRNSERLGAYASVDARISRDFALPRGTLNVFAEVTNALDRQNPCCTEFSYSTNPNGLVQLEHEYRFWLPLVPNVGVLWKF